MRTLHGCFSYTRKKKHREASIFAGKLPEESEQFRFLRSSRLANLKYSVGLILAKTSTMWVTIPIDLSTGSFIPLPRFFELLSSASSS